MLTLSRKDVQQQQQKSYTCSRTCTHPLTQYQLTNGFACPLKLAVGETKLDKLTRLAIYACLERWGTDPARNDQSTPSCFPAAFLLLSICSTIIPQKSLSLCVSLTHIQTVKTKNIIFLTSSLHYIFFFSLSRKIVKKAHTKNTN